MTDPTRLRWPTGTDYSQAVQSPQHSFTATELTSTEPVISALGVPMVATGQNAVVFLLRDMMQRSFALRCFTTPSSDGAQRYQALSAHLATVPSGTRLAAATWIDDGVHVRDRHWPVVLMPWVNGKPMNLAVEDMLEDDPASLVTLADRMRAAVDQLQAAQIAHGDLQHGNVLVAEDGQVTFVDLDGVWVPHNTLPPPNEIGHPNYQHPGRDSQHWGRYVDSFSALLIDTSLRAMAADPSLADFMGGESLVVSRPDLMDPASSTAFRRLAENSDPAVRHRALLLQQLLRSPFELSLVSIAELESTERVEVADPFAAPPRSVQATPAAVAAGNWWEQDLSDSGQTVARPGAPTREAVPAAAAGRAALQAQAGEAAADAPRSVSRLRLGRAPEMAGALGGLFAGIFGCLLFGIIQPALPTRIVGGVFVVIVGGLLGGMVMGWQSLVAGQVSVASRRFAAGLGMGVLGGAIGVIPADAIIRGMLHLPDPGYSTSANPVPVAIVWAIAAACIGLSVGALQNRRAQVYAAGAGAVAGFLGGLVYGATAAEYQGERLVIKPFQPSTILATALVASLIGLAIGAARKQAALGTLTVIEGPLQGLEVLLKPQSSIGSSALLSTLALADPKVMPTHVLLEIVGDSCRFDAQAMIMVNGNEKFGPGSLQSGDVILQVGEVKVAVVGFAPYPWASSLTDIPAAERPKVQVLNTASPSFKAIVAAAIASGKGPADACAIDVPVKIG